MSGVSGSGQVVAGVRHDLPRGAAPLPRDASRRTPGSSSGERARPAVRSIDGLSPAIAVDQRTTLAQPALDRRHADRACTTTCACSSPASATAPAGLRRRAAPLLVQLAASARARPARASASRTASTRDLLVADPAKTIRAGRARHHHADRLRHLLAGDHRRARPGVPGARLRRRHAVARPDRRSSAHIVLNGSDRIRIPYGKHPLESRLRWSGITARPREEGVYKGILPVMEQILRPEPEPEHPPVRAQPAVPRVRRHAAAARGALGPLPRAAHRRDVGAGRSRSWPGSSRRSSSTPAEAPVGEPIRAGDAGARRPARRGSASVT